MAQRPTADFNIDPNVTSGTDLANILNRFQDAIDSGNSGASRPAYLDAGGLWVREGDPMRLYLYDGTSDRELYNTTDGIVGALEDGTVDGQVTTWNQSAREWTPDDTLIVKGSNVGIGTDSPNQNLVVYGETHSYVDIRREGQSSGECGLQLVGGTGGKTWTMYQPTDSNDLRFYTGNVGDALTIDDAGDATFNGMVYVGENLQGRLQESDNEFRVGALGSLVFRSGGYSSLSSNRMTIDSTGKVGIGMSPLRQASEAKEQLEDWKSAIEERMKAEPKADRSAVTQEITGFDKLPTLEQVKERLERAAGDKLQVSGNISASGTVSADQATIWTGGIYRDQGTYQTGLRFFENQVAPSGAANALTDGAMDIGATGNRFKDAHFSGTVYANGSPLTRVGDIIETFRTLKNAVSDETTVEGIKEALTNSLGGLIEKFEAMQSAATQEIEG